MAKTKEQKQKTIESTENLLHNAKSVILVNFDKLSISDTDSLRAECRNNDIKYTIVKKNLLQIALKKVGKDINLKSIHANVGIGVSASDDIKPAKIFYTFSQTKGNLFKLMNYLLKDENGALSILEAEDIKNLAELPSQKELQQKACFVLRAPLYKFVNVYRYSLKKLLLVLQAKGAQLKQSGS